MTKRNPLRAQRSGVEWKRRRSGMSELSRKAEARDMKLALTKLVFIRVRVHPFPFRTR